MTPLWLIMLAGLLGSSHCLGMCGAFAAIVGMRNPSLWTGFRSQLIYSGGRLTSYVAMGGVAGYAGKQIADSIPTALNAPAILCLIAGVYLVREGLLATGILRRAVSGTSTAGCLMGPLFSTLLRSPGMMNTFIAGMFTGFLPCGLVYAFLSLAASSADLLQGMQIMLAFGSGTVPLMVLAGCGSTLLGWTARQRLWKLAAWSVLATGLLTMVRGLAFIQWTPTAEPVACPFCAGKVTNNHTVTSPFQN